MALQLYVMMVMMMIVMIIIMMCKVCSNSHLCQFSIVVHVDSDNLRLNEIDFETDELRFHQRHGQNAIVSADGRTASRPSARGEFNDAIVMSNRPLADNELFEVRIDKMVERWSGSIEAGRCTL